MCSYYFHFNICYVFTELNTQNRKEKSISKNMRASQPCELCGCGEVNLHDGFYFCAECGTQDTNFQETIVEVVEAGGEVLHGQKRKIHKIVEEQKEMSDAWYKWHAFNFLLKGIADELLEYGANPSFKTKLMWVWTRYIKKYLKKDEMGLNENPHKYIAPEEEDDSDSDQDQPPEDLLSVWDKYRDKVVKSFSFTLLVTLIYIALNLDKSVVTLTHLIKLFRDGLLSVPYRIHNIVPKEMKPEKLRFKIKRGMANFKAARIRVIAMTLFKRLDLGNPVVPDLRLIIDNYLKELCLPTDLKPLVLSLMQYKPCSFLDVNAKDLVVYKIPAYEFHVMTYIIWALKLCLGLDCEYEVKLSAAAEAINEKEDRPQSFCINGESAPTNRLFSFREWNAFYQFRQILLRHHCYRYANKCSWDTDDYVALEHHMDLLQSVWKKDLKDEMAYELLHRLKGGVVESFVIPRSEFKPTLTPFHSYSQVLAQHLQDPELKVKLTEDFTQYSLKYAIEDWNLVNPNSKRKKNLVKGITVKNKEVTNKFEYYVPRYKYNTTMVYVRNCENHNWLTTKPPTLEHLIKVDKLQASDDDEQDLDNNQNNVEKTTNNPDSEMKETQLHNGVDSKSNSLCEISSISDRILYMDDIKILESSKLDATEKSKLRKFNDSIASNAKFPDIISEKSFSDSTFSSSIRFLDDTKVFESGKLDDIEREKLRQMHDKMSNPKEIKEETEGVNIFDDDFKPLIKEEIEEPCGMDYENITDNFQDIPTGINQTENSVVSSIDSVVNFNENTFDRANAIREIIMATCKKHKLPIPAEYNIKECRKKEMGLFSKRIDSEANRVQPVTKRNTTYEKQRRGVWEGYVTEYQAALQNDVLNQIAQKVNLAVQNANSAQANEAPPLDDTVNVEDANADTMEVDAVSNHSDVNVIETNVTEQASGIRSRIRYESDEDRLFSEESDGETHAKELLPEKNPDYDEEVYDASQLYVKAAKTADDGEMELDPQLSGIIDKKMAKDANDPSLLTWTEERKKLERPDSEDEMPLSVLQELQDLGKRLSQQENQRLEPFLDEKVEDYQYWLRCYVYNKTLCRVFEKEICNELPKSFTFLLRQCAHILGVSEGDLYRNLQSFETTAVEKSRLKLKRADRHYDFTQF